MHVSLISLKLKRAALELKVNFDASGARKKELHHPGLEEDLELFPVESNKQSIALVYWRSGGPCNE